MRRRKIVDSEPETTEPALDEASASGEKEVAHDTRDERIARVQNDAVERTQARSAATVPAPRQSRSEDTAKISDEDVGEAVSATWGEELYTPQQFFTFRVGPFSRHTKIRKGETALMAKQRVEQELEQMAAAERTKKMTIFLDTMEQLFGAVKARQAAKS